MPVELKVPSVGESITEVQLGDWLKKPGELARADEGLVVIETDKVTTELPAPSAGTVARILKKKGEKAVIGEVIQQSDFEFYDDETYRGYSSAMRDAAVQLRDAVQKGDYESARAGVGSLKKSCDACHGDYRS